MDIKKLITGFLILSAIVSSSVLLFSNFPGNSGIATNAKQNDSQSANKVPDNVFVEPIPTNNSSSAQAVTTQDDSLPPISTSSNLTDRLAASIIRDVVKTNPNGPSQDQGGQLSLSSPDLDTTITKTLSGNNSQITALSNWNIKIPDADIKVIKNSSIADLENYFELLKRILNNNIADPNLISLVQNGNSSPEAINAISVSLDQTELGMKKLSVPEQILNFHKSFLTLLAYQKNAITAINSDDPLGGALAIQIEEKNYNSAVSNFQNEIEKAKSVIKGLSLKGDTSSLFADLFEVQSAHAQFVGAVFDAPTEVATALTWTKIIWGYVKAIITQTIKNQLVHKIMAQTLNWIQGGGKPQFITNWKVFIGQTEKDAAGLAIQKFTPGLCRSLGPLIQLQLNTAYLSSPIQICTLDQVVQNVKNFYTDFAQGGWVGYGAMILPSGNYYGSLFETTQKIEADRLAAANAARSDAQSSGGFLSTKICVKPGPSPFQKCMDGCNTNNVAPGLPLPAECYSSCQLLSGEPDNGSGCLETKNTTPGTVAGDAVATAISAPLHNIVNASDIVGVISALVDSAITRLFRAGVNGLLGVIMNDSEVVTPNAKDIYDQEKNLEDKTIPPPPTACTANGQAEQDFMLPLLNGGASPQDVMNQTNQRFNLKTGSQAAPGPNNTIGLPEFYLAGPTADRPVSRSTGKPWDVVSRCDNTGGGGGAPPSQIATVQRIHDEVNPPHTAEGAFEVTRRVAAALGVMVLKKAAGENIVTVNGVSYSAGRICYPGGHLIKILSDIPATNGPEWLDDGPIDPNLCVPAP